jgi:PadR family transcriptional regulator
MRHGEIPPGALDLLVLVTLVRGQALHGFEIVDAIERASNEVFSVPEGSLYPALQRMLVKGWVTAKWGATSEHRRARYYRITAAGRRQLDSQVSTFDQVFAAIHRVIRTV